MNWDEEGRLGSKRTVKFSKGTVHPIKIRERKGPSRGVIQKCEPHERNPCAPRFEERTRDETSHQDAPAEWRGTWRKYLQAMLTKLRFILLLKPGQCQRLLQNLQKNENS